MIEFDLTVHGYHIPDKWKYSENNNSYQNTPVYVGSVFISNLSDNFFGYGLKSVSLLCVTVHTIAK